MQQSVRAVCLRLRSELALSTHRLSNTDIVLFATVWLQANTNVKSFLTFFLCQTTRTILP